MSIYQNISEKDIENKVFKKLENLGYITDYNNPNKDVFFQTPKSIIEKKKLKGKRPDFIIYDDKKAIAIIETKKPNNNLYSAELQAESYAKSLGAKIIFAYDGYRLFSKHIIYDQELQYGSTPLTDFVNKETLKQFIHKPKIDLKFGKKIHSEKSFIQELKNIENILWNTGLKQGDARFTEFCKILFIRLIFEKEKNKNIWEELIKADDKQKIDIINGNLQKLNQKYKMGKYGEKLNLDSKYHYNEISQILSKLDEIDFINTSLDVKGNAFEFFLGYRGLNDDLAQYFTPRRIIRFMCDLVEPKPGEKIYDPFCGSGGILINAFEFVKNQILFENETELKNLKQKSIFGADINDIAYVAKMNMILVGDGHANIVEQKNGSLVNKRTSQYDVVMTNIPFNLPLTKYNNHVSYLYDVPCDNGNSICVQHCLDALVKKLDSRACIIIPEQFIFHQQLKETRQNIISNYDVKIFSLPQGVFEPYTKAKTCILYLEYKGTKGNLEFINIENVGFSLDKKKNKIQQNDLTQYIKNPIDFPQSYKISYEQIQNNDFLFQPIIHAKNNNIKMSDILEFSRVNVILEPEKQYFEVTVKNHGLGVFRRIYDKKTKKTFKKGNEIKSKRYIIQDEVFIYSTLDARNGSFGKITNEIKGAVYTSTFVCFKLKNEYKNLDLDMLTYLLASEEMKKYFTSLSKGTTNRRSISKDVFLKTYLPFDKEKLLEYNKLFLKDQEKINKFNQLKKEYDEIKKNQYQKLNNIFKTKN